MIFEVFMLKKFYFQCFKWIQCEKRIKTQTNTENKLNDSQISNFFIQLSQMNIVRKLELKGEKLLHYSDCLFIFKMKFQVYFLLHLNCEEWKLLNFEIEKLCEFSLVLKKKKLTVFDPIMAFLVSPFPSFFSPSFADFCR